MSTQITCKECGCSFEDQNEKFCPQCGAKVVRDLQNSQAKIDIDAAEKAKLEAEAIAEAEAKVNAEYEAMRAQVEATARQAEAARLQAEAELRSFEEEKAKLEAAEVQAEAELRSFEEEKAKLEAEAMKLEKLRIEAENKRKEAESQVRANIELEKLRLEAETEEKEKERIRQEALNRKKRIKRVIWTIILIIIGLFIALIIIGMISDHQQQKEKEFQAWIKREEKIDQERAFQETEYRKAEMERRRLEHERRMAEIKMAEAKAKLEADKAEKEWFEARARAAKAEKERFEPKGKAEKETMGGRLADVEMEDSRTVAEIKKRTKDILRGFLNSRGSSFYFVEQLRHKKAFVGHKLKKISMTAEWYNLKSFSIKNSKIVDNKFYQHVQLTTKEDETIQLQIEYRNINKRLYISDIVEFTEIEGENAGVRLNFDTGEFDKLTTDIHFPASKQ